MLWLLCLLALLACSHAQTSSICSQATATINSQADATSLADCSTISGSVLVSSSASGVISIDGPQTITGDLTCENAGGLTSLGSITIGTIGGSFSLSNLTLLSTLSMNDLSSVKTIAWSALPALSSLTFPSTVSQVESITISNTFLSSLDGLNPSTIATLNVNNNERLKTFSTQVASASSAINFNSNGNGLDLSFPNLIWAANITIRNVSSLDVPSLSTVNGSIGLYGNDFTEFTAPNLTTIGSTATGSGTLALVQNPSFTDLSLPLLKTVGGAVQVANNQELQTISFPALATVGGAIEFSGNFSTPNLPALTDVKGGFNVQSTASIDCSAFAADEQSKVIQGTFVCKGSSGSTTTTGGITSSGTPTPTSSSNSTSNTSTSSPTTSPTNSPPPINNNKSSGLSGGAIAGIVIGVVVALIIAALIFWARKKGYKFSFGITKREVDTGVPHPGMAELPRGGHHEKTELSAVTRPSELSAARLDGPMSESYELPAHAREGG
ncbi:uncharacterized protein LY89DRAFT_650064 [Mollisia scopiformis]|uniref:Uncharacterized protein n=1 Tax=Mollisia scopiformis TaxID=149040 RepID=A0A194X3C5_MOLSC|nr:uncharacterized protein LY89DRAFT_650064 [Mollisia scopiformis]KUJ14327.1 hypothetical protein LY89DRAFT_650064 [Mollisia scopiformis]